MLGAEVATWQIVLLLIGGKAMASHLGVGRVERPGRPESGLEKENPAAVGSLLGPALKAKPAP